MKLSQNQGAIKTTSHRHQSVACNLVCAAASLRGHARTASVAPFASSVKSNSAPRRASRSTAVVVKATQAALGLAGTVSLSKLAPATPVFVAGAQGSLGIRIAKQLLDSGFKVIAGADYLEEAQATLDFARKYELLDRAAAGNLKLQEVDVSDEGTYKALPKRCNFIIVENDSIPGKRFDTKYVEQALAAAKACSASQVVVISLAGSAGGFGSGFFSPRGGNSSGSKTEQLVKASGLPYVVVRASGVDKVDETYAESTNIVVTQAGGVSTPSPISKGQLSAVVAELLKLPGTPSAGCVLEATASPTAAPAPLATIVASVVGEARAKAAAEAAAAEAVAVSKAAAAKPAAAKEEPKGSAIFSFGKKPAAAPKKQVEEEEEEEEAPKASTGFFGFGAPAKKANQPPVNATKTVSMRSVSVAAPAKRGAKEEDKEEKPKSGTGIFGFFAVAPKTAAPAKEEEEEEEEKVEKKPSGFGAMFGFGARKPAAEEEEEEEDPRSRARSAPKKAAPPPPPKRAPPPPPPSPKRAAAQSTSSQVVKKAPAPAPPARGTEKKAGPTFKTAGKKGDDYLYL